MNVLETKHIPVTIRRSELSVNQRDEMFSLLQRHFDGVDRTQFELDLAEKNWVILLQNEIGLAGFSTIAAYETIFEGRPMSVVCSGDTIVTPEAWGTTSLSRAWISCVRSLRASYPHGKYYWLLLTSGFRTYRFLPVFWREFFPQFTNSTHSTQRRLLDHLASERYGKQYDPKDGIVRFEKPQRLRTSLQEVPIGRTSDPHVSFFLSKNPGYIYGDELVCLTELEDDNLTSAGRRMIS
jgi:hypothetical protein